MRKYVLIDASLQCATKAIGHPLPEEDRRNLLLGFSSLAERAEEIAQAVNMASLGMYRIVETDNFGGDYPDEKFLLYPMPEETAKRIVAAINAATHEGHNRFWKVEPVGYRLQPGFEP